VPRAAHRVRRWIANAQLLLCGRPGGRHLPPAALRPARTGQHRQPSETTILQFAETINRITNNSAGIVFKESQRTEGDPQRRQPDITRARQTLGWEPRISLEEGLARTIPYFKQKLGLA